MNLWISQFKKNIFNLDCFEAKPVTNQYSELLITFIVGLNKQPCDKTLTASATI